MAIFKQQRLRACLQKPLARLKVPRISMRSVTIALIFSVASTLSLKVMADRYQYPLGDISKAELFERHEVFKRNYDAHEVTGGIDLLPADLEVKILFGIWCHDSEREVPRMLKLLAASGVKEENISLISLDIRKEEPKGRAKVMGVRFTPTFVFFSEGTELGRIIERPIVDLAHDLRGLVKISKKGASAP
jgi:thiol-disulfide isomerase/thioredoxin